MSKRKGYVVYVSEKGYELLSAFSAEHNLPLTDLTRAALVEYLRARGEEITEADLRPGQWGGQRTPKSRSDET
jgi:hypothetical protein